MTEYPEPEGYRWKYIGTCPCGGADMDHSANDEEWELIPCHESS